MSNEYINRQAAIDDICETANDLQDVLIPVYYMGLIKALPAADVAPVVHAYWIPQKENHEFKEALMNCSACGYPVSRWTGNTNFCPNCGAKMDGERKEEYEAD